MSNQRSPRGYGLYKTLMQARGVRSYLSPSAYQKVGALQAYEAFLPKRPKAVVPQIRAKKRRTGGVSGLF